MPARFPGALVVRLEENYRSTPEILSVANRLVPELGGSEKVLRAQLPRGDEPLAVVQPDRLTEAEFVVGQVRRLAGEGVPYEEMAVLYRLNARSEDYEEAFALAGIPFQVRGAAFIRRPAAQRTLRLLRGRRDASALGAVTEVVRRQGWVANPPSGLGEEELTRQADLGRLLALAEQLSAGSSVGDFLRDLEQRFGAESQGRGVHLLTYHRAKGLEWEAVFLPRLEEKELPYGKARRPGAPRRGASPLLRRHHAREAVADDHVDRGREAEPLPPRARRRRSVTPAGRETCVHPGVRSATPLASRAREGGRGARIRRLPRRDAARDRRDPPADAGGAERDLGSRPNEAGAIRGRRALGRRRPAGLGRPQRVATTPAACSRSTVVNGLFEPYVGVQSGSWRR